MKFNYLLIVILISIGLNAQVTRTYNVTNAGTFYSLASAEISNISYLIVNGNIDARDIKVIRDQMPLLTILDLSGTTIKAYTGNEGTYNSTIIQYLADEIPKSSFINNTKLNTITFPSNLASIANRSFSGCTTIRNINMPNTIVNIGDSAFMGCTNLIPNLVLPTNLNSIGKSSFRNCRSISSVVFNSNLTAIGDYAFSGCTSLNGNITLPANLNSLGNYAFSGCSSINSSVTFPLNLVQLGGRVFDGCISITEFIVPVANSTLSSINGVLFDKDQKNLILYPLGKSGSYAIPNSVDSIADYAFSNCTNMQSVYLNNNITRIGDYAFNGCTGLSGNLILPSNLITLGNSAFRNCTGISGNLVLPSNLSVLGEFAFRGCTGITNITFPATLNELSDYTFGGCTGIVGSLILPPNLAVIGNSVFSGCVNLGEYIISTANSVFSTLNGVLLDKNQKTIILYPTGKIGSYIFPNTVDSIGVSAFSSSKISGGIVLPSGLLKIGQAAFSNCTNISNISFPSTVTRINASAFNGCSGLVGTINLPASLTYLGDNTFSGCTGVGEFAIPVSNLKFSSLNGVLLDKPQKTLILYPQGKLGSYIFPSSIDSISNNAFSSSKISGELVFPSGLLKIGSSAFSYCTGINSISLPATLTRIWSYAFNGCTSINTITSLNPIPPTINITSFNGINNVYDVFVSDETTVTLYKANTNWYNKFPGYIIKSLSGTTSVKNPIFDKNNLTKVFSNSSNLIINGSVKGETISVFNTNGQFIQNAISTGNDMCLELPINSIYLVKISDKTYKISM